MNAAVIDWPHEMDSATDFCVHCHLAAEEIIEHAAYECEVRLENAR